MKLIKIITIISCSLILTVLSLLIPACTSAKYGMAARPEADMTGDIADLPLESADEWTETVPEEPEPAPGSPPGDDEREELTKLSEKKEDAEFFSERETSLASTVAGEEDRLKDKESTDDTDTETGLDAARQLATRSDYRYKAPELLSRINGTDLEPLPFVVNDIYVVIAGHRARVVYDMVFQNPVALDLAGTLMIELPDGASPSYLGMFQGRGTGSADITEPDQLPPMTMNPAPVQLENLVGRDLPFRNVWKTQQGEIQWGELRPARVVNPVQGKEVYESITRRKVDPALAEWAGGNKFSTRVYPIPGASYKRLIFAYDRPLQSEDDYLLYTLPLPSDLTAETRIQVYAPGDLVRDAKLLAGTREVQAMETTNGKKWKFKPDKSYKENLIFYSVPRRADLQILAGTDDIIPGQLVHLRYQPEITSEKEQGNTGRALFLLDTSYSAKDKLYATSGKMLRSILEKDTSITEFAVICFDVMPRPVEEMFLENTAANREKILDMVEAIWLEGATAFSALLQHLEASPLAAAADALFLLSDGHITWGNANTRELENRYAGVLSKPWYCYTFGDLSVNKTLFNTLSRSGGQLISVGAGQDLAQAALAHRRPPASLDYIRINNGEDILIAGDPALVFPGQVLEIAARVFDYAEEIDFTISIDGRAINVRAPLAGNPLTDSLAARGWADLYVNRLLGLYDEEADAAVLALSQHFSLTNRQASFIILETDEEYVQYAIEKQMFSLEQILKQVQNKLDAHPYGSPDTSGLTGESLALLEGLGDLQNLVIYKSEPPEEIRARIRAILHQPEGSRGKNTPAELYQWAMDIYSNREQVSLGINKAYRILTTIIEEKPRDDIGARLVGYVLMQWRMYKEAAELFAGIRQRRPFEPQNYLIEGLALALQGKLKEAAVCYEIVLQGEFPRFDDYVKPVAALFYSDLLKVLLARYPGDRMAGAWGARLEQLARFYYARGRIVLFWNLDDTDVDLHVLEDDGYEVYYSDPNSPSGGKLYWDNTTGLGPEMYEHHTLSDQGFEVFVDYFGTSSVEGVAPSATLVCAFKYFEGIPVVAAECYSTVLVGMESGQVMIMPEWRR